ncbi:MAG: DsrE/DsrF/TusD sulfur relay family protein [Terriglobia bacterium]
MGHDAMNDLILYDAPYGSERSYNGLASPLARRQAVAVSVFPTGDAEACAIACQTTPNGYYNIERMLKGLAAKSARIGICGSSMDELTAWTQEADKILVF